ncbi:MAG: threonylcarbamoyl-AMP synthase [Chloroflexi bacterium]|nr:threonylcarbamoyl-AMP synthase [Chloroflexota bacterium]
MVSKLSLDIQEQVEKGISILRRGGVIAYPTDTVYGLGAGIGHPRAIERIYAVKERPLDMPLPLLVSDVAQITELAESVPPAARLLINKFLPGALTLVLPASPKVPGIVTAGGKTVAVRIPAHPVPLALIIGLGTPVVGTSANLSGQPSPLTADEVYFQLGDKIDFIIDGGRCPGGKESTIVNVTGEMPVILREGAISRVEIERVFGKITVKKED